MKRILFLCVLSLFGGCATQQKAQRSQVRVTIIDPQVQTYGNVKAISKPGSFEVERYEYTIGMNAAW